MRARAAIGIHLAGAALFAGAAAWVLLRHALSDLTPYWGVPLGLFFVAVVLFAGEGFWGLARARR